MKKLLASASFIVLSSATVLAADLPLQTKTSVMAAPMFSWTGCYVGAHIGAGAMHDSYTGGNGNGGLAGGQVGCNYQDGNWVFGVEGEGSWSGIKTNTSVLFSSNNGEGWTANNKNDFSIAARAGMTFDRTLVYGKAGWVWGQFDFTNAGVTCCNGYNPYSFSFAKSGTLDGLLLGVGIEHALTRNWTVKLEYNYLNFGSKAMAGTYCDFGGCVPNDTSSSATKQIFKLGANYLFDIGSAPLVAKY
jgi:outer membrane immunogenic protein